MPRGKPKISYTPDAPAAAENQETQDPEEVQDPDLEPETEPEEEPEESADPVQGFREALNRLIDSDPEAANKILAAVLGVAEGKMRTVESDRPRKVKVPKLEIPTPEPPEPTPGVVFWSKHNGFRLVLGKAGARYDALGNKEIIPPRLLDFDNGTARVTAAEDILKVRSFIAKEKAKGIEPAVIEIRDEIAQQAEAGRRITPIASGKVTADTALAELVTA